MVPGGGFEPPTRGFSVHCSTPELPGRGRGGYQNTPLGKVIRAFYTTIRRFATALVRFYGFYLDFIAVLFVRAD